jgi:hypothetical protein
MCVRDGGALWIGANMFALVAAVLFFLVSIGVGKTNTTINLFDLALCFLALEFAFSWAPWSNWQNRNRP